MRDESVERGRDDGGAADHGRLGPWSPLYAGPDDRQDGHGLQAAADGVRAAAFRRLLRTGGPARLSEIAADLGQSEAATRAAVEPLRDRGSLRLDPEGRVVGAGGLSVTTDRHAITLAGRRFWTWCAYDILGIFGATRLGGHAVSPCPEGGAPIEIRFRRGRPEPVEAVLFLPDEDLMAACENVYEQWCATSNFFRTRAAASSWASAHAVRGAVLALDEAATIAASDWAGLVGDAAS